MPVRQQDQPDARVGQELALLLGQARHAGWRRRTPPRCAGRISSARSSHDLGRARRVVLGQMSPVTRDQRAARSRAGSVEKPVAARPSRCRPAARSRPPRSRSCVRSRKSAVSSSCRQLDPDRGRARAVGIGRRLDPAQPVAQDAAQRVDGEAQRLALRRQLEDQLVLVVGEAVLERRDLGELRQPRSSAPRPPPSASAASAP